MLIDRVVVNASPLICLFKSGLEELFPALFKDVVVPEAVIKEVMAKGTVDLAAQTLVSNTWIRRIGNVAIDSRVASWDLGEGENSVLSFALRNPGYFAVMDDREARRCAISLQCHCIGTLGMVLLAKKRGMISSVRETLGKIQNAGLWMSETLVNEICRNVGEK
jgi:predicted nucleic acid-binding protein